MAARGRGRGLTRAVAGEQGQLLEPRIACHREDAINVRRGAGSKGPWRRSHLPVQSGIVGARGRPTTQRMSHNSGVQSLASLVVRDKEAHE